MTRGQPQERRDSGFQEPLVVICILNWNGWRNTIECVESVRKLLYSNYLVVVLDNGSLNESLGKLRAWCNEQLSESVAFVEYSRDQALGGGQADCEARLAQAAPRQRLVLIDNGENLGFNGGCNVVIRYALKRSQPADYVFLLNNDTLVTPDCLTHVIATAVTSHAGIVGAVIKNRCDGSISSGGNRGSFPLLREFFCPLFTWNAAVPDQEKEFEPCFYALGTARVMRRDVLEALHDSAGYYFDEAPFIYGGELEVIVRARQRGFRSVIANRAAVYHGQSSSSGGLYNPVVNYYPIRNRVREAQAMLPWYLRPGFHALHISWNTARAMHNLRRGRRRSALAIFRGLVDGYRGVTGKWLRHDEEVLMWETETRGAGKPGTSVGEAVEG